MAQNAGVNYLASPVPLSQRRGPITMGLLWITMVAAFPMAVMGFQWLKDGITLPQVLICAGLGCLFLFLYTLPAAHLGAKTGLCHGALCSQIFGGWGSRVVSVNILWIFSAWYSMWALLLADTLKSAFHLNVPLMAFAAALAIAMAFNNFFGFSGVANFARFVAGPCVITAVLYTFAKALPTCPASAMTAPSHVPLSTAITSIAGFVIGFMVWGNEADYWCYSKPKKRFAAIPLAVTIILGGVIFPVAGWMVAKFSGVTDFSAATTYMNSYSFGGIAWLAPIFLATSYFANNDSNMYGMINAVETFKKFPHYAVCAGLAIFCAAFAAFLSTAGITKSLESITSLNCVLLPTVTVIVVSEIFLIRRWLGEEQNISKSESISSDLPRFKWLALIALMTGYVIGIATSGVIPGTESIHVGLCSVQAWLVAAAVYIPGRMMQIYFERRMDRQILRQSSEHAAEPEFELARDR
jgi:purine-cytosine permease-like protein